MKRLFLVLIMICTTAFGTIEENDRICHSSCNGSSTEFTFDFEITDTSELVVILRTVATGAESVLTETTDYSVSATNNDYSLGPGGTVTTVETYSSAYQITIKGDTTQDQDADLEDSGVLRLETLEDALDKITMLIQELQEQINRCIQIPRSDTDITVELDDSVSRASTYLMFDDSGNASASTTVSEGSLSVSSFGESLIDDADADAAKTTLEIPTITSAAETVLDDATVAAMCTTLGAVQNTGNETIAGNKTLTGNITMSGTNTIGDGSVMESTAAPTSDDMISNKKYVDDAHKPYARMYLNSEQSNLTDITWTVIELDTDLYDSGTITDLANYKITPAVAGYYLVIGQVAYKNVIANKSYAAQIYKNGSTEMTTNIKHNGSATTNIPVLVTDVLLLDDDDYIQLRGYVNCGAATVDVDAGYADTFLVLFRM